MTDETRLAIIYTIQDLSLRLEVANDLLREDYYTTQATLIDETIELLYNLQAAFHTKAMRQHDKDWDIYSAPGKYGNIDD